MQENSTDPHPLGNLAYDWVTLVQNKAQALMALLGPQFDEQHRDLGPGLLAPGQHLGVADGVGQRQVTRGDTHPGDAVGAGRWGGCRGVHKGGGR